MLLRLLTGRRVGVIGFNARPIALSAKRAGAEVYVSDYWGDDDLTTCCREWVSVLNPQPGQRQRDAREQVPVDHALAQNFMDNFEDRDLDYVLLGSGFDDHPETVRLIEERLPLVGNHSEEFRRARDRQRVVKSADACGMHVPISIQCRSLRQVISAIERVGFPCIVRPNTSSGGAGIHLVLNENGARREWRSLRRRDRSQPVVVQQYVNGIDGSCSVLATRERALAVSVHGQLIGMPSAGRDCDFAYCGNYVPFQADKEVIERIQRCSEELCRELELVGSNGVDFVVDRHGEVWFMELNPRLQGTLELVERTGDVSVTEMHIRACLDGLLPDRPGLRPGVKMIIYARWSGPVPDLAVFPNTVDRTPAGVLVARGDPICSTIETGTSLIEAYTRAIETAAAVHPIRH